MRNVSDKSCRESQNTCLMFSNFFLKSLAICEEMHINIVKPGRPQMTICCMHIACWIIKATNMRSEYVILPAFPL